MYGCEKRPLNLPVKHVKYMVPVWLFYSLFLDIKEPLPNILETLFRFFRVYICNLY